MTSTRHHRRRWAALIGAGGIAAVATVAATNPAVREQARRVRGFARRVDPLGAGPPIPPALPPGRVIDVPSRGELFVRDSGAERPPVLLLHGWCATADVNWFRTYPSLADRYRVVALDHRGHGRGLRAEQAFSLEDCADDAAALLRYLDVAPAVVVGYSMGGPIALLLTERHPELVAGLVLTATALDFNADPRDRLLWRGLTLLEALLRHDQGDGLVERLLREAVDKDPSLDPQRAWMAGELRRGSIEDIVGAGQCLSRFDGRAAAAAVPVPCAFVVTAVDRLVPPRKQRALAAALGATVFELEGDHDVPIVGSEFGPAIRAAVDDVAARLVPTMVAMR